VDSLLGTTSGRSVVAAGEVAVTDCVERYSFSVYRPPVCAL